jgi:hypothetical protein
VGTWYRFYFIKFAVGITMLPPEEISPSKSYIITSAWNYASSLLSVNDCDNCNFLSFLLFVFLTILLGASMPIWLPSRFF